MSPHSLHNNNNSNNNVTTILPNITTYSSSSSFGEQPERNTHEATTSSSSSYSCGFKLNPPFDSAMALTVLLLLTALFFMGFLSIYIRRFADQNSLDPSRFRRPRRTAVAAPGIGVEGEKVKGADPNVVGSLPAYVYKSGDVEEGGEKECAICLGAFEEQEWVKEIPYCSHVFHAICIDTWLLNHVTCPLCRTSKFFPRSESSGNSNSREEVRT